MKTYKECTLDAFVLGTRYQFVLCSEDSDPRFDQLNCSGFCDDTSHTIKVSNYQGSTKKDVSVDDIRHCIRHAIIHELVHAHMFESGLGYDWEHKQAGQEETTVDWIAHQCRKIIKVAEEIYDQLIEVEL